MADACLSPIAEVRPSITTHVNLMMTPEYREEKENIDISFQALTLETAQACTQSDPMPDTLTRDTQVNLPLLN